MSEFIIAIHCLVFLGHKKTSCSSATIAKNLCITPTRVRLVMGECQKAGLVNRAMGQRGGYRLAKNMNEISLLQIQEAVDSNLVNPTWFTGDKASCCPISSNIEQSIKSLCADLNKTLEKDLAEKYLDTIEAELTAKEIAK